MKYYTIAQNPFGSTVQRQMQKFINTKMISDKIMMDFLPIDKFNLREDINLQLKKYELEIESILLFYRPPGYSIDCHVDFAAGGEVCNASVALPWICKDGYTVYWNDGEYDLVHRINNHNKDIEDFTINWTADPKIHYEAKIYTTIVAKTDIPHGVYSLDSNLLLATCRFQGNPSFEELSQKLMVE